MLKFIPADKDLTNDELKNAIQQLINRLLENHQLTMSNTKKEELVEGILNALTNKQSTYTRGELYEPDFIKKLSLSLITAISIANTDKFSETLKRIFDGKKIDIKDLITLSPQEFKKFMNDKFTPAELKEIHAELIKCNEELLKDMKKFDVHPKPEAAAAEKMADDQYINLFGLLNSAVTGAYAVPISQYLGNGLGLNDWNPYDGTAPIDRINSLSDYQFGDPLGLNASTVINYLQIGDTLVDEMQETLYHAGVAPGQQPPTLQPKT